MRIDIQAELTPQILAQAGLAYSTKDKVYGAKYRKNVKRQCLRAAVMLVLFAVMLVMFFIHRRTEFLVFAAMGLMLGGMMLYAALVGDKKRAERKLAGAGGETRHRRYLITDKKIESGVGEDKILLRWTDFDRYMDLKDCYVLLGGRVLVLPKAAFEEQDEKLLRAHIEGLYKKV